MSPRVWTGALRPLGDRVCDGAVMVFGAFTGVSHAVVWLGGSLHILLVGVALVAALAVGAAFWLRSGWAAAEPRPSGPPPVHSPDPPVWGRVLVAGAAAACGAIYALVDSPLVPWIALVVLAVLLAERDLHTPASIARPAASPRLEALLLALGLLCAALTLVAHRPDADDTFYVNLVVAAVEHPEAPLLAGDSMHGIPGVPLALPTYRAQSYQQLQAAVSYATGMRALDVAHLLLPGIAAFLVPLAWARLLRILLPGRWIFGVGAALAFLLCMADTSHSFANFAFVRMHQGKSVLLCVVLPVVLATALEFGSAPDRIRFVRLALAQIAAVGLSASAIWLAPLVAGLALVATAGSPLKPRTLLVGVTASTWVVGLGLLLRAETLEFFAGAHFPITARPREALELFSQSSDLVLGKGPAGAAALACALLAWAAAPTAILRRVTALFVLAFALLLWNPFTADRVAAMLTSPQTYWRVFWLLPLPAFVAAVVTWPLELARGRTPTWLAAAAAAALAVAVFGLLPARNALSTHNGVRLGAPGWKVPEAEWAAARAVAAHASSGELVLAPLAVSPWIPIARGYPQPLVVRPPYLRLLYRFVGADEMNRRLRLARLVSGEQTFSHADDALALAIDEYPLAAVCVARRTGRWPELRRALERSPLALVSQAGDYEVWAR